MVLREISKVYEGEIKVNDSDYIIRVILNSEIYTPEGLLKQVKLDAKNRDNIAILEAYDKNDGEHCCMRLKATLKTVDKTDFCRHNLNMAYISILGNSIKFGRKSLPIGQVASIDIWDLNYNPIWLCEIMTELFAEIIPIVDHKVKITNRYCKALLCHNYFKDFNKIKNVMVNIFSSLYEEDSDFNVAIKCITSLLTATDKYNDIDKNGEILKVLEAFISDDPILFMSYFNYVYRHVTIDHNTNKIKSIWR